MRTGVAGRANDGADDLELDAWTVSLQLQGSREGVGWVWKVRHYLMLIVGKSALDLERAATGDKELKRDWSLSANGLQGKD